VTALAELAVIGAEQVAAAACYTVAFAALLAVALFALLAAVAFARLELARRRRLRQATVPMEEIDVPAWVNGDCVDVDAEIEQWLREYPHG
jgi:hypothetical protein